MIRAWEVGKWRQGVVKACEELSKQYTKYEGSNFPFYALHGIVHSEKVAEIGNKLMKEAGISLDYVQSAVWECSAYLHDVGMGVGPENLTALQLHGSELAEYIKDRRKREKMLRKLKSVYCLFTGCRRPGEALDQCIQRGCVVKDLPDLGVVNVS
ncbi:HD domain-containing protein, partial [Pyrobaculum sp.]|uniref:HD domain-containing protein n=1 Tax=Pyrobaculum sp. TaxID=2004705 RepID=UPI003D10779B